MIDLHWQLFWFHVFWDFLSFKDLIISIFSGHEVFVTVFLKEFLCFSLSFFSPWKACSGMFIHVVSPDVNAVLLITGFSRCAASALVVLLIACSHSTFCLHWYLHCMYLSIIFLQIIKFHFYGDFVMYRMYVFRLLKNHFFLSQFTFISFLLLWTSLLLCNLCRPGTHCLPQVGQKVITLLPRPLEHYCFYSMCNAIADIVVASLPYFSLQCHDKILQSQEIINSIFFMSGGRELFNIWRPMNVFGARLLFVTYGAFSACSRGSGKKRKRLP